MNESLNKSSSECLSECLPSWNLTDLYSSHSDEKIYKDINKALESAKIFKSKYQNNLINLSPSDLWGALKEYEEIRETSDKPLIFAMLLHSADSSKHENGSLLTKLQELHTEISEQLIFFSLELNELKDEKAEIFMNSLELKAYSHYLKSLRKYKEHQLSEKEENLWQSLNLTGFVAWSRLFDETIGRIVFKVKFLNEDGTEEIKEMNEEQVLSLLYSNKREIRKEAAEALTKGLKTQSELLTYLFNVLLQDRSIEDKFRKYPNAKRSRNLSNDIDDETVETLMKVCEGQTSVIKRFYELKRKLLGLTELCDYDRYAPVLQDSSRKWSWHEAKEFTINAYNEFDPRAGKIVEEFYEKNWIDADLRKGKRGGAFAMSAVPSVHPYILVNFTNTNRDVSTLAHELGHGIHQYLSRSVGYLNSDTPLTTAETASVFGEMLAFERLLAAAEDDKEKLSLLIGKLDDIFATVFRQICMTRFEEKIHAQRREEGELKTEDFCKHWVNSNREMFGDSITWTENYSHWWSYIGHFVHSPFYCYAYSFGLLLSITLFNKYKDLNSVEEKKDFCDRYIRLLSLGGSLEPSELLKVMNVDLKDPEFWSNGLKLVDNLVSEAERIYAKVHKDL